MNSPSPKPRLPIYCASKLSRASFWLDLATKWPEFEFKSRWPTFMQTVVDSPENADIFWPLNLQDLRASRAILIYAEGDEHLRGAIYEAGYAHAIGLELVVVGDHQSYGTWQYLPGIFRVKDFDEARAVLQAMA